MEQNEKRYKGFTNYQTWMTDAWLDNDRATYFYWREVTRECYDSAASAEQVQSGVWTVQEAARYTLADRLKAEVGEGSPLEEASLYSDLLGTALQEVNWDEIASNWLSDLAEDLAEGRYATN